MKIKSNILGQKNGYSDYATNSDTFYTLKLTKEYYGEQAKWNGNALLPIGQMGPIVNSIALKTFRSGTDASFASLSGEFDFSHIDYTKIVKDQKLSEQSNGMQLVEPVYYPEATAKANKNSYLRLVYSSSAGSQSTDSSGNRSGYNSPTFNVLSPFLNSELSTESSYGLLEYTVGKLDRVGTTGTTFKVTPKIAEHPAITVTYSN